jgi:FMN-dependent NADH-azoreductase
VLPTEGGELAGTPVLDVVGWIAEAPEVLSSEHVPHSEEGLMRDAQETSAPRHAPDLPESAARVPQMLQYLQAHDEVVAAAPNWQIVHIAAD